MIKLKILVLDNGSKECKQGLVNLFIDLYEKNKDNVDIDFDNFEVSEESYNKTKQYDYIAFHRCIGTNYDRCIEFLKKINNDGTTIVKPICYVDEFWQLPKYHPYYKVFNKYHFHEKITTILKEVHTVLYYYNLNLGVELDKIVKNQLSLKYNHIVSSNYNIKSSEKRVSIGIVPDGVFDLENIKILNGVHKYLPKTWLEQVQFVLVGFDPRGSDKEFNKYTFEVTDVVKKPVDSIWATYEKIITNDYSICSPEYKDFLLKFIPNNKYDGDIENEPYKRIWHDQVKSNVINYNILLRPLLKDKYNLLKYDFIYNEVQNLVFNNKEIEVISTYHFNKQSLQRIIAGELKTKVFDFKQQSFLSPPENDRNEEIADVSSQLLSYLKLNW